MPALQVKDCPENVYESLRLCARRENRSMSQQALTILEEYLGFRASTSSKANAQNEPINYIEKRKKLFAEIKKLPPLAGDPNTPSAAELVRQLRDEEAR